MKGNRRGRWLVSVSLLLLSALLIGHYWYWYLPRARTARPASDSMASQLVLAREGLPFRLWLPYPHQNLAALEARSGAAEGLEIVATQFAEIDLARIPSFGPFRLPPSSELGIATDRARQRLQVVIRMYPTVRWLLRAAGAVAGNPWLSGGELELEDRSVQVSWEGPYWVASTAAQPVVATDGASLDGRVLTMFRIPRVVEWMPPGLFSLRAVDDRILISTVENRFAARSADFERMEIGDAAMLAMRLDPTASNDQVDAMALFAPGAQSSEGIPGAVVIHRGHEREWSLPGEQLLSRVGIRALTHRLGPWTLAAFDDGSLNRGSDLLDTVEAWRQLALRERVSATGEIDLKEALKAVRLVDSVLGAIPLVGQDEVQRWRTLSVLLDLSGGYVRATYRMGDSPPRFELVVE